MKGKHHAHHGIHAHEEHLGHHAHVKHHSMKHHADMKHHRKHHAKGGATTHDEHGEFAHDETPNEVYAGAGSHVVKEASKKKRGGALKHVAAHGHHAKHRLDRPARKAGGRTAALLTCTLSHPLITSSLQQAVTLMRGVVSRPHHAHGGGTKWIQGAIKHPGALHRQLHVPQGEKIPAGKLEKAAHSENPTLAKRARLAQTLKKMH
jgi:hypothetical protein